MKKLLSMTLAVVMLAMFLVSTQALAEEKKFAMTLGTTSAAQDLQTKALEMVAQRANELSGGTLTISVFPASQLGDANAQMESMIVGSQDMFMESQLAYMASYGVPELYVESFGLMRTRERLQKFLESDLFAEYKEKFREANGVVIISNNYYRNPIVLGFKDQLTELEDFEGYKLRVIPSESTLFTFQALGFNPTSVSYNEVYLALSQGVVQGTLAPFDGMYSMKFYEVAPYILKLAPSLTNMCIYMNEKKWNMLSDNQRAILKQAGDEAGDWYTEQVAAVYATYAAEMEAGGAVIMEPSQELSDAADEIWAAAAKEYEALGKLPEGTYDAVAAIVLGK